MKIREKVVRTSFFFEQMKKQLDVGENCWYKKR